MPTRALPRTPTASDWLDGRAIWKVRQAVLWSVRGLVLVQVITHIIAQSMTGAWALLPRPSLPGLPYAPLPYE